MKKLITWIAILGNLAVFFAVIFAIFEEGIYGTGEGVTTALLLLLFVVNLYLLFSAKEKGDWLSLFLRRKALEERKKIQSLES